MTLWFSSDYHFGHENILRLSNRPFKSIEEHNDAIVDKHNELVSEDDTVWILGDINLGKFVDSIEYVKLLNGHKNLVTGNHDRLFIDPSHGKLDKQKRGADKFRPIYEEIFETVVEGDERGVAETSVQLFNGEVVRVSHFPYGTGDSHDEPRFADIRPVDDGAVLIHGHTHSDGMLSYSAKKTLMIHVGVDSTNYWPVSEHDIVRLIEHA